MNGNGSLPFLCFVLSLSESLLECVQIPSWNGKLLAGFTSGTGKTYGSHAIESWNFWEAIDRSELNSQESSWFSSFLGGSGR